MLAFQRIQLVGSDASCGYEFNMPLTLPTLMFSFFFIIVGILLILHIFKNLFNLFTFVVVIVFVNVVVVVQRLERYLPGSLGSSC